jgi:hypothetical protein
VNSRPEAVIHVGLLSIEPATPVACSVSSLPTTPQLSTARVKIHKKNICSKWYSTAESNIANTISDYPNSPPCRAMQFASVLFHRRNDAENWPEVERRFS